MKLLSKKKKQEETARDAVMKTISDFGEYSVEEEQDQTQNSYRALVIEDKKERKQGERSN